MAKATLVQPQQPSVTLELTWNEAAILAAILGRMSGGSHAVYSSHKIYGALVSLPGVDATAADALRYLESNSNYIRDTPKS